MSPLAALDFESGSLDLVQVESFQLPKVSGTLSAWVKPESITAQHHVVWAGQSGGDGYGGHEELHLTIDGSQAIMFVEGGDTDCIVGSGALVAAGSWAHVVGTYENLPGPVTCRIFVDGVLRASSTGPGQATDGWDSYIRLGQSDSSFKPRAYDGVMDLVMIYDRPLGASEVAELYTAQN